MLSALLGLVGVIPGLASAVGNFLQARANGQLAQYQTGVAADTQIALAQINAQIALAQQQQALLLADKGWWVTAWIRPLLIYPFVLHCGAVVLDTVFHFGWAVPPLPHPFDQYEGQVLALYVGARTLEKVVRVFTAKK